MTIRYLYDEQDEMREWAEDRSPYNQIFRPEAKFIGIANDNGIKGVAIFECFGPTDCMMHVISDGSKRWLTRDFLVIVFAYPFNQVGLLRVTATVPSKNHAALKMNERLGFKREGIARKAMPDDDNIYMGMLREECRPLGGFA